MISDNGIGLDNSNCLRSARHLTSSFLNLSGNGGRDDDDGQLVSFSRPRSIHACRAAIHVSYPRFRKCLQCRWWMAGGSCGCSEDDNDDDNKNEESLDGASSSVSSLNSTENESSIPSSAVWLSLSHQSLSWKVPCLNVKFSIYDTKRYHQSRSVEMFSLLLMLSPSSSLLRTGFPSGNDFVRGACIHTIITLGTVLRRFTTIGFGECHWTTSASTRQPTASLR